MKSKTDPISVLHVIPYFVPAESFGGPVRVCFEIARHLASKNYHVTVATTDAGDGGKRIVSLREVIANVQVIRFRNLIPKRTVSWNMFLPLGFVRWMRKNIKAFTIVHLHSYFTFQNVVAAYFCKENHVPYIVHLHESPIPNAARGKMLIKIFFNQLFFRHILGGASMIITLTDMDKEELASYCPALSKAIVVIPNGIHIPKKKTSPSHSSRKNLAIPRNAIVILSLSRLAYLKGVDLLLAAFYEVSKIKHNVYFLIAGPDEGQRRILETFVVKNNLTNRVRFLGLVTGKQKEEIYKISDIYALCSRYEPFSLTTLEALGNNLPVCLSQYVGVKDAIISRKAGIELTNVYDAKKTAQELLFAIEHKHTLSKNCTKALRLFDIRRQFEAIEKLYTIILFPAMKSSFHRT